MRRTLDSLQRACFAGAGVGLVVIACHGGARAPEQAVPPAGQVASPAPQASRSPDRAPETAGAPVGSTPAPPASQPACPVFGIPEVAGTVVHPALQEISGMVASRRQPGMLWVHNDSGDGARLYAIRTTGEYAGAFTLSGATAIDWEDLAIGPGPGSGDHLYVADTGDNLGVRETIRIYRVAEPAVPPAMSEPARIRDVETFDLTYEDGRRYNSEALFVDPLDGNVYLVTKEDSGISGVFRARVPLSRTGNVLERVATVDLSSYSSLSSRRVTAADISLDGTRLAIRAYNRVFIWERQGSIEQTLSSPGCPGRLNLEIQGEAVAWDPTGTGYYTTSELRNQPVAFVRVAP